MRQPMTHMKSQKINRAVSKKRPRREDARRAERTSLISNDEMHEGFFDYDPEQLRLDLIKHGL